ncbi:MAG: putative DNA binding domain-containing protein [Propionibacteriaceae bacterium]|nr:putative DNA binding domain-containing protein [Propionibacteriaceae bacterium]
MNLRRVEEALSLSGEQAVDLLAQMPENQWFDRKSGRVAPRDLAAPLVAFANAEGGYIAVGIRSGQAEPLDNQKLNAIRQAAIDFTSPTVRTRFHQIDVGQGAIALVEIEPSSSVHETAGGEVYLRVGDESRKLSFAQRRELAYDRGTEVFSATALDDSGVKDLDTKATRTYQKLIGAATVESMLAARDLIDAKGNLRVAAWLMFAKHPSRGFPNAHVRVLQYGAAERGTGAALSLLVDRDARCEGTLPQQIEQASKLIDEWIPQRNALGDSGRFEALPMIPRKAWLEGLVNAVIHRSYSVQGDHIRVELFPNRIEISSPGRFPSFADPNNPTSIMRYARNPRIARVMAELGYAYELGEGIKRMFGWMRERGLSEPVYNQTSGHVLLTLFANPAASTRSLPKGAANILELVRQAGVPLGTGEVAELSGYSRPTVIRHLTTLRAAGLVVWKGESPRDPHATWAIA